MRIALVLACLLPLAALAQIGPEAKELLEINKKMAEPTCEKTRLVLEMAGASNIGQTERVEVLKRDIKKFDDDPKLAALTKRGRELSRHRFNPDEKQALTDQFGTIQSACPWLRPAPKK